MVIDSSWYKIDENFQIYNFENVGKGVEFSLSFEWMLRSGVVVLDIFMENTLLRGKLGYCRFWSVPLKIIRLSVIVRLWFFFSIYIFKCPGHDFHLLVAKMIGIKNTYRLFSIFVVISCEYPFILKF